MNSYTISQLDPSHSYTIMLCLKKSSHIIPVSSLVVTTRPESYMNQLGIVKDYTAIIAVSLILGLMSSSCIALSFYRFYQFRCSIQSDSISTKEMIVSPSETADSLSGGGNETLNRNQWYLSGQDTGNIRSRLVDHEVTSPIDDLSESIT